MYIGMNPYPLVLIERLNEVDNAHRILHLGKLKTVHVPRVDSLLSLLDIENHEFIATTGAMYMFKSSIRFDCPIFVYNSRTRCKFVFLDYANVLFCVLVLHSLQLSDVSWPPNTALAVPSPLGPTLHDTWYHHICVVGSLSL